MVTPYERLLEDPTVPHLLSIDFVEKTYCNDHMLAPTLFRLRDECTKKQADPIWLEEKLHEITQKLLHVHRQVLQDIAKVSAMRASTREELYKRIHLGHDFISTYYDQPLSLTNMAKAACLSPSHFIRGYKQFFSISF